MPARCRTARTFLNAKVYRRLTRDWHTGSPPRELRHPVPSHAPFGLQLVSLYGYPHDFHELHYLSYGMRTNWLLLITTPHPTCGRGAPCTFAPRESAPYDAHIWCHANPQYFQGQNFDGPGSCLPSLSAGSMNMCSSRTMVYAAARARLVVSVYPNHAATRFMNTERGQ